MANSRTTSGTIVITGASGLIGTRLTRQLQGKYDLVGIDRDPPRDPQAAIDYIRTDLTDDESTRQAFESVRRRYGPELTSVFHLAAYYDFSGEPSPLYNELTVEGTRRVLQNLLAHDFQVQQIVFSSTLLVMQPDEQGRHISELSPTQAEWAYPESKLKAEQVLLDERGTIPVVILRIAGVYDEQCHSLPLSQQIARIYEQRLESYVFPGDKTHGQALVHLDDLAECFEQVVTRRDRLGPVDVFLIAEPDVMSYEQLQDRLGTLIHGRKWATLRIPKVVAEAGAWMQDKLSSDERKPFIKPWMVDLADDHYAATIMHAWTKLGWDPQRRLRDTLPAMIEFLKRDPQSFYEENGLPVPQEVTGP
jgi:nucleoside-diphosphate-sugar epimerase